MCKGAAVLRVIATVFLIVAFLALFLGYLAPFWTLRVDPTEGLDPTTVAPPVEAAGHKSVFEAAAGIIIPGNRSAGGTPAPSGGGGQAQPPWPSVTPGGHVTTTEEGGRDAGLWHEGLWAKCHANLSCVCFAEFEFKMEKDFSAWHKAVQGLFGIGLLLLLAVILVVSFNVCCCACCRQSAVLATVLGALVLVAFLLIVAALAVYGGFACKYHGVGLKGPHVKFDWGYYLSIAGALLTLLPAGLFICDGRRTVLPEHEDCETAKMV